MQSGLTAPQKLNAFVRVLICQKRAIIHSMISLSSFEILTMSVHWTMSHIQKSVHVGTCTTRSWRMASSLEQRAKPLMQRS
jgi:hypothetical protein